MISVTDSMIVQVYKRQQNASLVTLTFLQHPLCPLAGVRVQNPCMLKACSHLDTPTQAAVDIIMCPQVVECNRLTGWLTKQPERQSGIS